MSEVSPWTRRQRLTKRSFDLLVAVPLCVLSSPVVALAIVSARLDTGQTGIFAQRRVGRNGRLFTLYKIRTMRHAGGSTVTTSTDSRVTTLGRWLRTSKVDELPQLVNVIRGDMSLVGPRPDVPGFADLLVGDERVVLAVPPGITGPASLHYRDEERLLSSVADPEAYNHDVVYPEKVRMNVDYVRRQSLATDLRYLGRTLLQTVHRAEPSQGGAR
jgi:lipopolysaccharide/colanic/teichoic acid biosynthesis glycosyltransferase